MEISKIKIPGVQNPIDIKDTTVRENLESQDEAVSVALNELESKTNDISSMANEAYTIASDAPDTLAVAASLNDLEVGLTILNNNFLSSQDSDILAIASALNILNKKIMFLQEAVRQLKSQINN